MADRDCWWEDGEARALARDPGLPWPAPAGEPSLSRRLEDERRGHAGLRDLFARHDDLLLRLPSRQRGVEDGGGSVARFVHNLVLAEPRLLVSHLGFLFRRDAIVGGGGGGGDDEEKRYSAPLQRYDELYGMKVEDKEGGGEKVSSSSSSSSSTPPPPRHSLLLQDRLSSLIYALCGESDPMFTTNESSKIKVDRFALQAQRGKVEWRETGLDALRDSKEDDGSFSSFLHVVINKGFAPAHSAEEAIRSMARVLCRLPPHELLGDLQVDFGSNEPA